MNIWRYIQYLPEEYNNLQIMLIDYRNLDEDQARFFF